MEHVVETPIALDDMERILIPEAIKQRLGLLPGMHLVVEPAADNNVYLRVEEDVPQLIDKGGVLVVASQAATNSGHELKRHLGDFIQQERNRRVSELLQRVANQ